MLEAMLNLEIDATRVDLSKSSHLMREPSSRYYILRCVLTAVERVGLTLLSVGVSILVPGFSSIMALLGSLSAFMLCIIGPILARVVLTGRCGTFDSVVLGIASIMAVWGTITAFWAMGM